MSRWPVLPVVATLLTTSHLLAQEITGPLVLRLPGGARALALGNAYVAGRGPEVLFYNPAQIAQAMGLMVSVARYRSASTHAVLSSTMALGNITLGFGAQYLNYRPVEIPTQPGELGEKGPLLASSLAATAAGSLRWKGIRWGVAAKYVQEQVPGTRSSRAAFDFGAGREVDRFTVGLAIQNLGGKLKFPGAPLELPTRVSLGAVLPRYPIGTYFDIGASAAVARERDGRIVPGGGVELLYQPVEGWLFSLRAGAHRPEAGPGPRLHPLTLGAGIALDRVSLDYAFEAIRGGGGTHRVGIRVQ